MDPCRQIENLIYLYAERIDAGDLEGVADLFRNAEIVSSAYDSRHAGYDEVLQLYQQSARLYADTGTPKTRHLTSNVIIELDEGGSDAHARSCYTVFQSTSEMTLQPIISGRYEDRFRKTQKGWQFARREMFIDLVGDLSAHLLYDIAEP